MAEINEIKIELDTGKTLFLKSDEIDELLNLFLSTLNNIRSFKYEYTQIDLRNNIKSRYKEV